MTPDQLKHAMRALHLTDKHLAQLTGKHDRTVRRWVSGEIAVPLLVEMYVRNLLRERSFEGAVDDAHRASVRVVSSLKVGGESA